MAGNSGVQPAWRRDIKQNPRVIPAFQRAWQVAGLLPIPRGQRYVGEALRSLAPSSLTARACGCVLAPGSACSWTPPVWAQPGVERAAQHSCGPRGSERGNRLLWLLGIVQLWTCPGQRLVNDSFVGAAGWLGSARDGHVSHWPGCRKYPASEEISVWVGLNQS